jgi:hypothetical protein
MSRWLGSVLALCLVSQAFSQDKPPAANGENLVEVRTADGSAVKVTLLVETIDVQTRFGRLTVPIRHLRRIDFGLRYPDGLREKIEEAIGQLGHSDFRRREAAQAELLLYPELAYPLVAMAANSGNAEAVRRSRAILEEIRNRVPGEKLDFRPFDSVQTTEFPIVGVVELAGWKARSSIFGETTLKLADLRQLRALSTSGDSELVIDAARHGLPQEHWLETNIEVIGNMLEIRAEGKVDLYPLGGERGMYMATPDGARPGGRPTRYPSGALLGKVGASGKTFLVGSHYQGIPDGEGKLFLKIEASPWGTIPSGSYTVKITLGK